MAMYKTYNEETNKVTSYKEWDSFAKHVNMRLDEAKIDLCSVTKIKDIIVAEGIKSILEMVFSMPNVVSISSNHDSLRAVESQHLHSNIHHIEYIKNLLKNSLEDTSFVYYINCIKIKSYKEGCSLSLHGYIKTGSNSNNTILRISIIDDFLNSNT